MAKSGTVRVLAIDGGGIRGIIPAIVLAAIEQRTGEPIASLFDLIVGTSTGGIIALGLVVPGAGGRPKYTAEQILALYRDRGREIFPKPMIPIIQRARDFVEERYDAKPLERVLRDYFGDTKLSQALRSVVVSSYDIEAQRPYFFKSWKALSKPSTDVLMRDAARATSAAPTYFEPAKLKLDEWTGHHALIDGGVAAGNPALCGLAEARRLFPNARNQLVVSLGTGQKPSPIAYADAAGWGLANWARPILGVVFDGSGDVVDYQLEYLLNEGARTKWFYRFQQKLIVASDELDDASDENIHNLALDANEILIEQGKELDRLLLHLAKLGRATMPYQLG